MVFYLFLFIEMLSGGFGDGNDGGGDGGGDFGGGDF